MPIIKSAIKRMRQAEKRNVYNSAVKTEVKKKFRVVKDEVTTGKSKDNKALVAALTEIDKAVKKGVISKHSAARKKSQLTRAYNSVAAQPFGTEKPGKPGSKSKTTPKKTVKKFASKRPSARKSQAKK